MQQAPQISFPDDSDTNIDNDHDNIINKKKISDLLLEPAFITCCASLIAKLEYIRSRKFPYVFQHSWTFDIFSKASQELGYIGNINTWYSDIIRKNPCHEPNWMAAIISLNERFPKIIALLYNVLELEDKTYSQFAEKGTKENKYDFACASWNVQNSSLHQRN